MTSRYDWVGPAYDLVSLEPILYRRPRAQLMAMLGPLPGATVVDVGCGTALNAPQLRRLVAPGGRIIGIDASPSMLATAHRRARRSGWVDVTFVEGDAARLLDVLDAAGVDPGTVGAVVATFVLSLLADDAPVWTALDELASRRPVRVGVADLGSPAAASVLARPFLRGLTALGGGQPERRPWEQLAARAADTVHEVALGGHVHLAAGTTGRGDPMSSATAEGA